MFWGAFSWNRRTSLYPMLGDPESPRGGVTARRVLECLQEQLPTICEPGSVFIQDNAPTHTAKIVQEWLVEWAAENGVVLVDWPPFSPDLNAIENLWKILKERICTNYPELLDMPKNDRTKQRLVEAAIDMWESLEEDLLRSLVKSMTRRLEAVIEAGGWYTKY
jgi:transposase